MIVKVSKAAFMMLKSLVTVCYPLAQSAVRLTVHANPLLFTANEHNVSPVYSHTLYVVTRPSTPKMQLPCFLETSYGVLKTTSYNLDQISGWTTIQMT